MIETASWPPKCATDSSERHAQDSRPALAASASPLPDQAIQSRPARPRGLRNSGPRARPPQLWRLDRQAFCDFPVSYVACPLHQATNSLWALHLPWGACPLLGGEGLSPARLALGKDNRLSIQVSWRAKQTAQPGPA